MSNSDDPAALPAPTERIGFLIYRAGLLVSQAYEAQMRPLGFAPVEIGLMTCLASSGENHVRAVARVLGVSPQTVVNVSLSLEARGLLARAKSSADGRTLLLSLTPSGRQALGEIDVVAQHFDEEIIRHIGEAPAQAILSGLRALLHADVF